jgi:hypothetical protein
MDNLGLLDNYFKKVMENLTLYLPEGVEQIDVLSLFDYDLFGYHNEPPDHTFTRLFQIVETEEKITLVNEEFIIWILPRRTEEISSTFVLIALNKKGQPHLEKAFIVSGVYNTSKIVLSLLEKELNEIQENEGILKNLATGTSL